MAVNQTQEQYVSHFIVLKKNLQQSKDRGQSSRLDFLLRGAVSCAQGAAQAEWLMLARKKFQSCTSQMADWQAFTHLTLREYDESYVYIKYLLGQ